MLIGRSAECQRIDDLLTAAWEGRGGALLLRGEPGIGKSALLEYAIERAVKMVVMSARGLESDSELPFSGLSQLLSGALQHLTRIPGPQARAIEGAFALGPPAADRFAVHAGVLSLLAVAAESKPVLAVVDDLHWLDIPSREAVLFAARRIGNERVALLFAMRDEEGSPVTPGALPELRVEGLSQAASAALLEKTLGRSVIGRVSQQLFTVTGGNPLGLIETAALLTEGQLRGKEPLEEPLKATATIELAFNRKLATLSATGRALLLLCAATDLGELDDVVAASQLLGIDSQELDAAESRGLISIAHGRISWHHPLLRSTVYHGATPADRRNAHAVLARVLDHAPRRRAMHLGLAASAPDEDIAAQLEIVAADDRSRGGHSSALRAFERAAELSPNEARRAVRLFLAASEAALLGYIDQASSLLQQALQLTQDPVLRADIQLLRSRTELWSRSPLDAEGLLHSEAARIEAQDPGRAALMLAEAAIVATMSGQCPAVTEAAEHAVRVAQRADPPIQAIAEALYSNALILNGRAPEAYPFLLKARATFKPTPSLEAAHPTLVQAAAHGSLWVGDHAAAREILKAVITAARAESALFFLPFPLSVLAELEFRVGHWLAAEAAASEAIDISTETSQFNMREFARLCLAIVRAGQGREAECRRLVNDAMALIQSSGSESLYSYADWALGLLDLGFARAEAALLPLERLAARVRKHGLAEPGVILWAPDLVECYIQLGRPDDARSALRDLEQQAESTQRPWAMATAARCRAMLADPSAFEEEFAVAMRWHDLAEMPFERARTELRLGVRRRRTRQLTEARPPLRAALETFSQLGAVPWAEQAGAELRASGETTLEAVPPPSHRLTAQELQVALAIVRGATNRDAATALFVSPKTIEFHLGNVYRKLGVRSRSQLVRHFLQEVEAPDASAANRRSHDGARPSMAGVGIVSRVGLDHHDFERVSDDRGT